MSTVTVFAASSDFTVRQLIGDDTVPPTTPGTLSVTNVTSGAVELAWGASTDDFIFGGYQVYRDGGQIATTTLTTYADTGLSSSTLYTYYVRAFDQALNFSSSSNIVNATTLATTTPVVTRPSSAGVLVRLIDLQVTPSFTATQLRWVTNLPAVYELRWGETYSYELGFVTNGLAQKDHVTQITELTPNTTYVYELRAYDRQGVRSILSVGEFTTLALPDTIPPANVSRFTAYPSQDDAVLMWLNPQEDFSYVRIVRNPLTYPTDPNNGFVVYEGSGEGFTDRDALRSHSGVYYTAFVFDAAGNRSSGAVAYAGIGDSALPFGRRPTTGQEVGQDDVIARASSTLTLTLDDVVILQGDEVIRSVDDSFLVDTDLPFVIQAPFRSFPRNLKTIQVTLSHPVDQSVSYSYLLRANADRTAYEAKITDLGFSGTIPLELSVYDYRTTERATASGFIISKHTEPVAVIQDVTGFSLQYWWLILLLLLLIFFLLWKRQHRSEGY